MYTNPHSQHGDMLGERSSTAADAEARRLVLDMCHAPAEEYVCIFTSGATGMVPHWQMTQGCRSKLKFAKGTGGAEILMRCAGP